MEVVFEKSGKLKHRLKVKCLVLSPTKLSAIVTLEFIPHLALNPLLLHLSGIQDLLLSKRHGKFISWSKLQSTALRIKHRNLNMRGWRWKSIHAIVNWSMLSFSHIVGIQLTPAESTNEWKICMQRKVSSLNKHSVTNLCTHPFCLPNTQL